MRRLLPLLALVAVLTGCASAGPGATGAPSQEPEPAASDSPSSAEPVPRFVGAADDGAVYAMTVGQTTTLRLPSSAPAPVVEGEAVLLIESVNVTGSASNEWEVRAVAPGEATLRGGDGSWSVALRVSAG